MAMEAERNFFAWVAAPAAAAAAVTLLQEVNKWCQREYARVLRVFAGRSAAARE